MALSPASSTSLRCENVPPKGCEARRAGVRRRGPFDGVRHRCGWCGGSQGPDRRGASGRPDRGRSCVGHHLPCGGNPGGHAVEPSPADRRRGREAVRLRLPRPEGSRLRPGGGGGLDVRKGGWRSRRVHQCHPPGSRRARRPLDHGFRQRPHQRPVPRRHVAR